MDQHQVNVVVHIPAVKGRVQLVLPIDDLDADTLSALRRLLETRDLESLDAKDVEALSARRTELILNGNGDDHYFCIWTLHCINLKDEYESELVNILAQHEGGPG
jgi:hypothetical protein